MSDRTDRAGKPIVAAPGEDPRYAWIGLDVQERNIPFSLRVLDQWVLWKEQPKKNGIGRDKVPYTPMGKKASSTDAKTWSDFSTCLATYGEFEDERDYSGIGLAVKEDNELILLDFDHVRDPYTGDIVSEVLGAIKYLGSYAEISPSGTGIRVIGRGLLPHAINTDALQGWSWGRYVTVTGHHLPGTPQEVQTIDQVRLQMVVGWFKSEDDKKKGIVRPDAAQVDAPGGVYHLPEDQVLELRHALGYLDPDANYDNWIMVGMALKDTGASNAFGLWNEWSMRGAKYRSEEMPKKWAGFTAKRNGVTIASIFDLAQKSGWVNPGKRSALEFAKKTGQTVEEANRLQPEPVIINKPAVQVLPFPNQGLNEIAAWIEATASVSYPVITQQAVLALVSTAAARLYITPYGDPLSTYFGACARSIGELRYAQNAVKAAFEYAGLRRMVRPSRITSPASLLKTLIRSPVTLYLSDDYGGVTAFSKRQPSGLQEHALSMIASVWDGARLQLDGPEDAGLRPGSGLITDDQPVIQAPCLSMLALISTDHLVTLMRASEMGRGAMDQLLLAIGEEEDAIEREPTNMPPPPWLGPMLRRIRRAPDPSNDVTGLTLADVFGANAAEMLPIQTTVAFPEGGLSGLYAAIAAVSDDRRVRSLLLSAKQIARRIAGALAVWENPEQPLVTEAILNWTQHYICARLTETIGRFGVLHSEDGKVGAYEQVLLKVTEAKSKGVSQRDLHFQCYAYRKLGREKRSELIQQMIEDGVIVEVDIVSSKTKRKNRVLVAAAFVKTEQGGQA